MVVPASWVLWGKSCAPSSTLDPFGSLVEVIGGLFSEILLASMDFSWTGDGSAGGSSRVVGKEILPRFFLVRLRRRPGLPLSSVSTIEGSPRVLP